MTYFKVVAVVTVVMEMMLLADLFLHLLHHHCWIGRLQKTYVHVQSTATPVHNNKLCIIYMYMHTMYCIKHKYVLLQCMSEWLYIVLGGIFAPVAMYMYMYIAGNDIGGPLKINFKFYHMYWRFIILGSNLSDIINLWTLCLPWCISVNIT